MIKISQDGTILATCSSMGTLIRVWNTATGDQLKELRRGKVPAKITDLTIDSTNQLLACASDRGTIHVFSISGEKVDASGFMSYFGSSAE